MSMVDVTKKPEVYREATAKGQIKLRVETIRLIKEEKIEKGNPLHAAKIAGILAAKNTSLLIPLCHPLPLTNIELNIEISGDSTVEVESTVKTKAQTGVEMEALVATTIALLTIWDMTKQYEKDTQGQYPNTMIQNIRVTHKVKGSFK
ncbi:cyclic pyranopterin monophosphate synthase MoaC [Candidatus Bathyarchaeota archaeon]|jgi:cyclic pyranopterin phosphate synthase|nr:cyclic pyranopterin monophosphate synthase MoaC [Candidatus Bathyarchaeota archaeon]